jgi:hypothetical protein
MQPLVRLLLLPFAIAAVTPLLLPTNCPAKGKKGAAKKSTAMAAAISYARARVQQAQANVDAEATRSKFHQAQSADSDRRKFYARIELIDADARKYGSSHELDELRAKAEKAEAEDSPFTLAQIEYDTAKAALTDVRHKIYASDKYQALYRGAMTSIDKSKEFERVNRICFEEDVNYKAAKERVENARIHYNQIRYKLYEELPEWADAVQRAKTATVDRNKAATTFKATAIESGIERINARVTTQSYTNAVAELTNAQRDLAQLTAQQTASSKSKKGSGSQSRSKKK